MIQFGFNKLAMLTFGLGKRMHHVGIQVIEAPVIITFRDKPLGIAVEEKTGPASFEDGTQEFKDKSIGFEDR